MHIKRKTMEAINFMMILLTGMLSIRSMSVHSIQFKAPT